MQSLLSILATDTDQIIFNLLENNGKHYFKNEPADVVLSGKLIRGVKKEFLKDNVEYMAFVSPLQSSIFRSETNPEDWAYVEGALGKYEGITFYQAYGISNVYIISKDAIRVEILDEGIELLEQADPLDRFSEVLTTCLVQTRLSKTAHVIVLHVSDMP